MEVDRGVWGAGGEIPAASAGMTEVWVRGWRRWGRALEDARGVWSAGGEIPAAKRGYDGKEGADVAAGGGSGRLER